MKIKCFHCIIASLLGKIETAPTSDIASEENNTETLSSSAGEDVQIFMQDSQEDLKVDESEANNRDLNAEELEEDKLDKENDDQSQIKHETEENVGVDSVQDGQIPQTNVEKENHKLTKNKENRLSENTQPMQVSPDLSEDELVSLHGPGPLVTELEDEEQLETIHLPTNQSLRIDELPDLEDVDTEDFHQQDFKPKIEVISGDGDEERPTENQGGSIFGTSSLFLGGCKKSTGLSNDSSLVYPEDEDVVAHYPGSNQPPSEKQCLIE